MPAGELERLRQRKRELLLESDINRQILRVELCQLKLKASDWKRGLFKARTVYHWVAPLAGVSLAIYGMKKKMSAQAEAVKRNGRARGKADYVKLFAPLGAIALRKALSIWRHARRRTA